MKYSVIWQKHTDRTMELFTDYEVTTTRLEAVVKIDTQDMLSDLDTAWMYG